MSSTPPAATAHEDRLAGRDAARIHLGLVICLGICIPAFAFELYRALGGNSLSWAYVFEWPILACFGVYMWWKLLHPESTSPRRGLDPVRTQAEDADLAAWNRYLAELHDAERGEQDPT